MTIREVTEEDFPQLIDLFTEFAIFQKTPYKMTNTVEKMQLEKDFFKAFIAVSDENEVMGFATFFFCYFSWSGKSIYLDDLYVKPAYQGFKIGTQLINKVIDFGKIAHCHKVRWLVSDWNTPAIDFYKKLGADINSGEYYCDFMLNK
jgi:GNAT superfamily N-acetyltransferase